MNLTLPEEAQTPELHSQQTSSNLTPHPAYEQTVQPLKPKKKRTLLKIALVVIGIFVIFYFLYAWGYFVDKDDLNQSPTSTITDELPTTTQADDLAVISSIDQETIQQEFITDFELVLQKIADGSYQFSSVVQDYFNFEEQSSYVLDYDNPEYPNAYNFLWVTKEGIPVSTITEIGADPFPNKFKNDKDKGIVLRKFDSIGGYEGNLTDQEFEVKYTALYNIELEKYKALFSKYGFIFNEQNTAEPFSCADRTIAFEKDELKCMLIMMPSMVENHSTYDIGTILIECSKNIDEALRIQKFGLELLRDYYNINSPELLDNKNDFLYSLYRKSTNGSCKEVGVNASSLRGCGGYAVSFANYDGQWRVVHAGHDSPECSALVKRGIDKEESKDCKLQCYEEESGTLINYTDY